MRKTKIVCTLGPATDSEDTLRRMVEAGMRLLGLRDPKILVTGFDRPNLYFAVDAPKDKYAALRDYLENHRGASGIVYCLTRKTVEEVTTRLVQDGFAAARYHAGLESAERQQNQDDFLYDRARIMLPSSSACLNSFLPVGLMRSPTTVRPSICCARVGVQTTDAATGGRGAVRRPCARCARPRI